MDRNLRAVLAGVESGQVGTEGINPKANGTIEKQVKANGQKAA